MIRPTSALAILLLPTRLIVFSQDIPQDIRSDIDTLASRTFLGRGFPLGGHKLAADFLKERFRQIGLQPGGDSYAQEFDVELNVIESVPKLTVNGNSVILGKDFLPFATSGSGDQDEGTPLFYVKSGVFVPNKMNDFASVSQPGSILLIDEEIPASIQNDKTLDHQFLSKPARIEIASILKSSAVIFLVNKLMYSTPYTRNSIPVFDLLKTALPNPVEHISFDVESSFDDFEGENIIGVCPGTAGTDSTIIISAHYDHVGAFADSLFFPGANDNATGVAMLLELARYFVANPPKHNILFIAFSAEEVGLIGSKYYSENPVVPLDKTLLLLNLDTVGSGDDGVMVVGGEDHPQYFEIFRRINDSLKIGPLYKRATAPNSDQWFVSQKGVKTVYLYTNSGRQPYHSIDDVPATLDWKAFGHVFALSKAFLQTVAN